MWGAGQSVPCREVLAKFQATQNSKASVEASVLRTWLPQEQQEIQAFGERVADRIEKSFKKYTRRSGAGPGNARFEHWEMLADDPVLAKPVARTLTRFALDDVPLAVKRALLSAR